MSIQSKIGRLKAGSFSYSRQHPGADLLPIVKHKDNIAPARSLKYSMRTTTQFEEEPQGLDPPLPPANSFLNGKDAREFGNLLDMLQTVR